MPVVRIRGKEDLKKHIAKSQKSIVYIGATWCGACDPARFESTFAGATGAAFAVADFDECGLREKSCEWATGYAPTVLLTQNGKLVEKFSGNKYEKMHAFLGASARSSSVSPAQNQQRSPARQPPFNGFQTKSWPSDPRPPSAPLVGKTVRVGGLGSRPDLNGATAVAESFNSATGRYNLRIASSGEKLAALPANMQPLA